MVVAFTSPLLKYIPYGVRFLLTRACMQLLKDQQAPDVVHEWQQINVSIYKSINLHLDILHLLANNSQLIWPSILVRLCPRLWSLHLLP